jgi:DNA-binding NarL/FixJ family response regulator
MKGMPLRVLLADDHALVRSGIRSLLQALDTVSVVGEAGDGVTALQLIEQLQPEVVLMDIAMPGLNGLDTLAQIHDRFPAVRVIILSMHTNEAYVSKALRSGAMGYLIKDAATVELELALQAVARGDTYLSPAVSRQLITNHLQRDSQTPPVDPLTPRQRQILQAIAEGQTTQQMARALNISVKTVETHRAQLMARLGIHDVAGLVRYAIKIGLISAER